MGDHLKIHIPTNTYVHMFSTNTCKQRKSHQELHLLNVSYSEGMVVNEAKQTGLQIMFSVGS